MQKKTEQTKEEILEPLYNLRLNFIDGNVLGIKLDLPSISEYIESKKVWGLGGEFGGEGKNYLIDFNKVLFVEIIKIKGDKK